jgi:acetolactate synthase-1/2/3 large subunit
MGFLRAIRRALPDDGIYVEDVTQVGFASRLALPVFAPRTFLSPGYQDTLGWGIWHSVRGSGGGARTESGAGNR